MPKRACAAVAVEAKPVKKTRGVFTQAAHIDVWYLAQWLLPFIGNVSELAKWKLVCKTFQTSIPRICTSMHMTLKTCNNAMRKVQDSFVEHFFEHVTKFSIQVLWSKSNEAAERQEIMLCKKIMNATRKATDLSLDLNYGFIASYDFLDLFAACKRFHLSNVHSSNFPRKLLPNSLQTMWLDNMTCLFSIYRCEVLPINCTMLHIQTISDANLDSFMHCFKTCCVQLSSLRTIYFYGLTKYFSSTRTDLPKLLFDMQTTLFDKYGVVLTQREPHEWAPLSY